MLHFIKNKIKNKKLLNLSLLSGVILLAAFLCIYPMFREGSLNKLLQTLFENHVETENEFPAVLTREGIVEDPENAHLEAIISEMEGYEDTWNNSLNLPVVQRQRIIYCKGGAADSVFGDKTKIVSLGNIPDMYEYVDLVHGIRAEDARSSENEMIKNALAKGAYPCVISQACMDNYGYVVGESLEFKFRMYGDSESVSFVVVGIIEEKEEDGYFFHKRLADYYDTLFVSDSDMEAIFSENSVVSIEYLENLMYDYTKISADQVAGTLDCINQIKSRDDRVKEHFSPILVAYGEQEKAISVILLTFELPIVALLLLFLYMISRRILEMETTEIAMLKSRGIKRGKIIKLYVIQSSIIAFTGCVIGLPAGYGMCKLAAGTDAFLSFTLKNVSIYKPTIWMIPFAGIAFLLAVLFMTLPVIRLSKLTITERKSLKLSLKLKPLWENWFLDILLLVISSYLLYNYYKGKTTMANEIISGGSIDPVLFLDSSLFILACGLLMLRLVGYLVRLIYRIGRKKWKPDNYMAFLQIIRSSRKQGFISVFLVMTIAMGIFNANLARTVNDNMEQRTAYNIGSDLRIEEKWKLKLIKLDSGEYLWSYKEPDFGRFEDLKDLGVISKTRVIIDENSDFTINSKVEKGNTLMAINTREFGETASMSGELNDEHWYEYLNRLAKVPAGCIISRNLADKYNLKEGDEITYSRYSPVNKKKTYVSSRLKIVGIVDAFPGFESTVYNTKADGGVEEQDKYLVVANYSNVVNSCYLTPYTIWMKLSPEADSKAIIDAIENKEIILKSYEDKSANIIEQRNSAMIQITNGMFSVGFIVSLLICAVGFLIYWILTIRERELLYGIYRAMGMSMKEIFRMLFTEQIFSTFLSILSGFGVGMLTTFLFTKLLSIVYLPRKHNIPISVVTLPEDVIKIVGILLVAFVICIGIMRKIIKNMNITKALKMGED